MYKTSRKHLLILERYSTYGPRVACVPQQFYTLPI